jgi:hypothetical protein
VILVVPAATPVTMPVPEPTEAIAVLPLLHVPVPVTSLNVELAPAHAAVVPVIDEGSGLTVIAVLIRHPVLRV